MTAVTKSPTNIKIDMSSPVTDKDRKDAEFKLQKAKVQLVVGHPFWAQIVFNRRIRIDDRVPTAYVTPKGAITVGTRFIMALNVQQLVFLLAHEAMHYAMLHFLRRAHRNPGKWNIAGDAVINDLLQEGSVGEFIDGGVNMPGSKDKTAEKVYDELPDSDGSGEDGYAPGNGFQDLAPDDGGDDGSNMTESEKREIETQVRVELAQAAQIAKQQGKMPASLQRLVDSIINPITPWYQVLERFMTGFVASDYSWRRPRKNMSHLAYFPSSSKIPSMGPVVVAVDTSGSIGDRELSHFLGHINRIIETCNPEKLYVVPCDAQVYKHTELTVDDLPITKEMAEDKGMAAGGGGTDFRPVFDWVNEQGLEPDVLVYLTDMYGSFPESAQPFETVWLSISEVSEAPFGTVVPYKMAD